MSDYESGEPLAHGRFEVLEKLGKGAMGAGYLCRDTKLDTKVVCKIALETLDTERAWHEFKLQFDKLLTAEQMRLVKTRGLFDHDGRPVLVLEWIDGHDSLAKWAEDAHLHERLAKLSEIVDAVLNLHKARVTHGDFSEGANIIVHPTRGCIFIDPEPEAWGATASQSTEKRTDLESLSKTIDMLAPEYLALLDEQKKILATSCSLPQLTAVVATIRAFAQNPPMIGAQKELVVAAGKSFQEQAVVINDKYLEFKSIRQLAIGELFERIGRLAAPFGIATEVQPTIDFSDRDTPEYDEGNFPSADLKLARGTRALFFEFEQAFGVPKLRPYAGTVTFARGVWRNNYTRHAGTIELEIEPESLKHCFKVQPKLNIMNTILPIKRLPNSQRSTIGGDKWIVELIADFTGTPISR